MALLGAACGDEAVTEGPASDRDISEGLRFFLVCFIIGGASSSFDAFRFRNERAPSGGSSGRISSLNIECPVVAAPRWEGSKSLASFGTDESLRRVRDLDCSSDSCSSSSSSSA
jgi:hypothetical protein